MIRLTYQKRTDGIEVSFGDDKAGGGLKLMIKQTDFLKLEDNLGELLKMAEDYLNQNYISLHEKKSGINYFNANGDKI
jgi:hypothetical protein